MSQQINRIDPRLPAHAMTTFQIRQAQDRRVVSACEEVGCLNWRHGWDVVLDASNPAHLRAAEVIRAGAHGRTFRELPALHGAQLIVFRFEAGQRCFDEHRTKPVTFRRRGGDHRGNPRQELVPHRTAADWQEDFAEHQDRLAEAAKAG